MSAVLERAKAHYEALPSREISVPEWGEDGKSLLVTWKKLTVRDEERIYAPVEGRPAPAGTVRLRTVILKACGADGKRLFTEMDEHDLRHKVDGAVVARVAGAILFGAGLVDESGDAIDAVEQIAEAKKP